MGSNHMHDLFRGSGRNITLLESGERKIIKGSDFRNGLCKPQVFKLGESFLEDKNLSSSSLRFYTDTSIYYKNHCLISKGHSIPYFAKSTTWEKDLLEYKAKVFFDIRPYGDGFIDFDPSQIHDGKGNYGKDCGIEVVASYEVNA